LSRVSAYDWFGSIATQPIGMAIWGPISLAIGISTSLWVAGALLLAIALGLLCVRDIRRVSGLAPAPAPTFTDDSQADAIRR
jgi:hypothetical protein